MSDERIKIKLDYPAPANRTLIHEIEIKREARLSTEASYTECEVFIDTDGWWKEDKVWGKHVLGIEWKDEKGNTHYFTPGIEDLHEILLGFCYVTMKNDQFPLPHKGRIVEKDLSGIEALLVNLYKEVRRIYGQKWIDHFIKQVEEEP